MCSAKSRALLLRESKRADARRCAAKGTWVLAASPPAYPLPPRRTAARREQVCWCLQTAWRLGECSGSGRQGGETEAEIQSSDLFQQGRSLCAWLRRNPLVQGLWILTPPAGGSLQCLEGQGPGGPASDPSWVLAEGVPWGVHVSRRPVMFVSRRHCPLGELRETGTLRASHSPLIRLSAGQAGWQVAVSSVSSPASQRPCPVWLLQAATPEVWS